MLMRTLATIRLAENHPCRVAFTDAFIDEYNRERPHQGLGVKVPVDVYGRSERPPTGSS